MNSSWLELDLLGGLFWEGSFFAQSQSDLTCCELWRLAQLNTEQHELFWCWLGPGELSPKEKGNGQRQPASASLPLSLSLSLSGLLPTSGGHHITRRLSTPNSTAT